MSKLDQNIRRTLEECLVPQALLNKCLCASAAASMVFHDNLIKTIIHEGASIGANATVICGNDIGKYSMVGAGSVVTKGVPDYSLFVGNPARFRSWICICTKKIKFENSYFLCTCGRKYEKICDGSIKVVSDE